MANESTISDLKLAIRRMETEKRRIEEQLRALVTSLQYFEDPKGGSGVSVGEQQRAENKMRSAVADILAAAGGPLHRREIYDQLLAMDVHVGGQDPVSNVGAHLSIDPRFSNVGRGMWDLAERIGTRQLDDLGDGDHHDLDEEDSVPW